MRHRTPAHDFTQPGTDERASLNTESGAVDAAEQRMVSRQGTESWSGYGLTRSLSGQPVHPQLPFCCNRWAAHLFDQEAIHHRSAFAAPALLSALVRRRHELPAGNCLLGGLWPEFRRYDHGAKNAHRGANPRVGRCNLFCYPALQSVIACKSGHQTVQSGRPSR